MEFETQAQKACYEKVSRWIKDLFGVGAIYRDDIPVIGIIVGSALAQVGISAWGEIDTTITTRAYLVTEVEITPDLASFLLHENERMRFGAFGLDKEDDIFFEHTIMGSNTNREELKSSIMAVILTADSYDDKIVEQWGGQRMLENS